MKVFFFLVISLFVTQNIFGASGDLDLSFGTNGKTVLDSINGINALPSRIALQTDGKIIFAGNHNTGFTIELALARFNANGTIDSTFGSSGIVRFGFGDLLSAATDVAIQSDGKIVVVGIASNNFGADVNFAVARLNSNGSFDTSFNGNGRVTTSFDGNLLEAAFGVVIQPDGKIIAAGARQNNATGESWFAVARYNPNGSLDTSFDGDGKIFTKAGNNNEGSSIASSIALQPDGKIVVAGETSSETTSQFALIRLTNSGALDASFDGDGKVQTSLTGFGTENANAVTIQPDGKIVAVGNVDSDSGSGGGNDDFAIVRYNSNGTLDTSFDNDGKKTFSFGNSLNFEQAQSVLIQPNNKIIIGGFSGSVTDSKTINTGFALAKLNPNGSFDINFGNGGLVKTNLSEQTSFGYKIISQPDGKIILGGISGSGDVDAADFSPAIVRFLDENVTASKKQFDFDGDGKSDISVFRPSNSVWYLNNSTAGFSAFSWGLPTDILAPADYDGDGKTDAAIYRDGAWYLLRSSGGFVAVQFGRAGDIPQPADFDGDGKAEIAVYRPSSGVWYSLNLLNNQVGIIQFGISEDKPVIGDYDGDGKADLAVFRPSNGVWYILQSSDGFKAVQWGIASDKAVPADYDGDGKTDIAVYRDGIWYIHKSNGSGYLITQFGIATDLPTPADYDGDGKADLAVYRDGVWYLQQTTSGISISQFGQTGDRPIANSFVR